MNTHRTRSFRLRLQTLVIGTGLGLLIWLVDVLRHFLDYTGDFFGLSDLTGGFLPLGPFFILLGIAIWVSWQMRVETHEQIRKLSRAVEQSPSIVVITDTEGRIEYVNPKFTQVTGYTQDEVLGENPRILKSGETPSEDYKQLWDTILSGNEWRGEFHNRRKNGELFWENASISPIKDKDGVITHFLAVKEDITARKEAEAAEREQRLLAEALRNVAIITSSTLDLDEVLDRLLVNLDLLIPHDVSSIMLVEDNRAQVVRTRQHITLDADSQSEGYSLDIEATESFWRMAATHQPVVLSHWAPTPGHWTEELGIEWLGSYVGAPILHGTTILGFFNVCSQQPGAFNETHAQRLQAFADQTAIAIHNARLFAAERDQRALSEALRDTAAALNSTLNLKEVLDRILANLGRVVVHDSANIGLIENGIVRIVRSRGYSAEVEQEIIQLRYAADSVPNLQRMIKSGQPHIVSDAREDKNWVDLVPGAKIRSCLGAPISVRGEIIGLINLDSQSPNAFTLIQAERLLAFADEAALALQNARLYDHIVDYVARLELNIAERTAELDRERAQLRAILDSMGEGVIYINQDDQVEYVNRALAQLLLFDYTPLPHHIAAVYQNVIRALPEFPTLQAEAATVHAHGEVWRGQTRAFLRDNTWRDIAMTAAQVYDQDQKPVGKVFIFRDISHETSLRERKDRFLAHAAHELRTPISNIKTRLYLMRQQPEKTATHLNVIEQVSDDMRDLVNDLLDMVRLQRHTIQLLRHHISLQDIVRQVISVQQPKADRLRVQLVSEMPETPIMVDADVQRLAQAITNLIVNAFTHTPQDSMVRVRLETDAESYAALHIQDSSAGISPPLLNDFFEPFFQARQEAGDSVGLSLAIAKEIVELHNGHIEITSEPEQGTVFTIRLPLVKENLATSTPPHHDAISGSK